MKDQYDSKECYCRMLGHFLEFKYCRTMDKNLPCSKILDCWFEMIPIQQFVADTYSKEELKEIFGPQKSRLESLLDIVGKLAKEKKEGE